MQSELEQLYEQHRQPLFSLALSITGCRSSAEDAVHDAFVKICAVTLNELEGSLAGYVYASVRNSAIDLCRRRKRQERVVERFCGSSPAEATGINNGYSITNEYSPVEQTMLAEQADLLSDALESLDQSLREVVILKVYAGLTFETIAQVTESFSSTVESRYRRAIMALNTKMRAHK